MGRSLTAFGALLATSVALSVSSCDSSVSATGSEDAVSVGAPSPDVVAEACRPDLKVGMTQVNLQALHFNHVNIGAERIASEAGVDLQIVSADDDPLKQVSTFDQFIAKDVDAIIVSAIDMEGINTSINKAVAAGIPVINVDSSVDNELLTSSIATDSGESGQQAADFLAQQISERGDVGIVGALNSIVQIQRQAGFVEQAHKAGFTEGPVVDGKNIQEQAQIAAENLLTGNPDLKLAYATGEPQLVGLAAAVQSQGAQSRLQAIGWDLSDAAIDGLEQGWLLGVVQQDPFAMGYGAMNAAIDAACGRPVVKRVVVPTAIVTKENYADYAYFLGS